MKRMLRWQMKRLFVACCVGFCFLSFARVFLSMPAKEVLHLSPKQDESGGNYARLFAKDEGVDFRKHLGDLFGEGGKVSEGTGAKDVLQPEEIPVPNSSIPMYSDDIINPHPFDFTIANGGACTEPTRSNQRGDIFSNKRKLFLVLLVKCGTNEVLDRMQIRRTWGSTRDLMGWRSLTMFLLGQPETPEEQDKLLMEDAIHHDLIQENFLDTYRNLTYKNMMGWKWIAKYCTNADYVVSIDADMHLNLHNLLQHLQDADVKNFAQGHLKPTDKPMRNPEDKANIKWYTPPEMYPEATYPPFLNGACYVMSGDVASRIFAASLHVRFLPWDDVFVGMVMKRLGVTPTEHNSFEQFKKLRRTRDYLRAFSSGIATGIGHHRKALNSKVISVWDYISKMHVVLDSFKGTTTTTTATTPAPE